MPLTVIVVGLAALNLEKAVFEIMGGFRESTANDGAYAVLIGLTYLSFLGALPLLAIYLMLARRARRDPLGLDPLRSFSLRPDSPSRKNDSS